MQKTIDHIQVKDILEVVPKVEVRVWKLEGLKNLLLIVPMSLVCGLLLFSLTIFLMAYWDITTVTLLSGGSFGLLNHYSFKQLR